jgi:hypothetical protein
MIGRAFMQSLDSGQSTAVLIVGMAMMAGVVIAVTSVLAGLFRSILVSRHEMALKREMLERGLPAESIVAVVNAQAGGCYDVGVGGAGSDLPCASEAVAESGGEWVPALVLRVGDRRYYVHFVGTEMGDNEWVGEDRIRFPSGSPLRGPVAPRKEPIEAEL